MSRKSFQITQMGRPSADQAAIGIPDQPPPCAPDTGTACQPGHARQRPQETRMLLLPGRPEGGPLTRPPSGGRGCLRAAAAGAPPGSA